MAEHRFDKAVEIIESLDKTKVYTSKELDKILFSSLDIKTLTSFYFARRMYERLLIIEGFSYKVINELNKIVFKSVQEQEDFRISYFSDIDDLLDSVEKIRRDFPTIDRLDSEVLVGLMFDGIISARIPELRIGDINRTDRTIRVDGQDYKINERTFSLLLKLIRDRRGTEYVFTGRAEKIHFATPNKMLKSMNDTQEDRRYDAVNIRRSGNFYRRMMSKDIETPYRPDVEEMYHTWLRTFYKDK